MFGITLNAALTDAKVYTKCELARELYFNGIPKTFISNCKQMWCATWAWWSQQNFSQQSTEVVSSIKLNSEILVVNLALNISGVCLIQAESGGYSNKVSEFPNLSSSYGVFQINSKEWCRKGRRGGECGFRCEGDWPNNKLNWTSFNQKTFSRFSKRRHQRRHQVCKSDLQSTRLQVLEGLAESLPSSSSSRRFKMFVWLRCLWDFFFFSSKQVSPPISEL